MERAVSRVSGTIGFCTGLTLVLGLLFGSATTLSAQQGLLDPDRGAAGGGAYDPGFLFSRPSFSLGIRGGMFAHGAGGELFDFVEQRFTLDGTDFRGLTFGVEGSAWLGDRFEMGFGIDLSRFTRDSEYRDLVEDDGSPDGLPIRQTTRLRSGPAATVGLRGYLFPRGEQLGRFIWIPRRWNVFAGAGVGATGYGLTQWGDFVDEETDAIFTSELDSDGYAGLAFVDAGIEVGFTPRATLVIEARHQWANAEMRESFSGFEPVDLSGTRLTTGIRYRF